MGVVGIGVAVAEPVFVEGFHPSYFGELDGRTLNMFCTRVIFSSDFECGYKKGVCDLYDAGLCIGNMDIAPGDKRHAMEIIMESGIVRKEEVV